MIYIVHIVGTVFLDVLNIAPTIYAAGGMMEEHPFDKYVGNVRLSPVETRETPPKHTHHRLNSGSLEFLDPFADEGLTWE